MKINVQKIAGCRVGYADYEAVVNNYTSIAMDITSFSNIPWAKTARKGLIKAVTGQKLLSCPYSIEKLLDLRDKDEYVAGCINALATWTVQEFTGKSPAISDWIRVAEENGAVLETIQEAFANMELCGNGFLVKIRNSEKKWVGIARLNPNEVTMIEAYDAYGNPEPMYIQTLNGKKTIFAHADVIHFRKRHRKSNVWGVSSLPITVNVDILNEIKLFDYNNFKNGLLIDWFLIVEGGSLRDNIVEDSDGNEVIQDAYTVIEQALRQGTGNNASHGTVLIESENPTVKIRLEKIRQDVPEGGFKELKKDLREGIFAYYGVPPRIVSQVHAGSLGGSGEVEGQMKMFWFGKVKPAQNYIASHLARHFRYELEQDVSPDDIEMGNMDEIWMSSSDSLFNAQRGMLNV